MCPNVIDLVYRGNASANSTDIFIK